MLTRFKSAVRLKRDASVCKTNLQHEVEWIQERERDGDETNAADNFMSLSSGGGLL